MYTLLIKGSERILSNPDANCDVVLGRRPHSAVGSLVQEVESLCGSADLQFGTSKRYLLVVCEWRDLRVFGSHRTKRRP